MHVQRWDMHLPLRCRFRSERYIAPDGKPLPKARRHSRKDFEVAIRNPSKKPTTARLIREAYRGPEVREAESVDETARWIWDYTLDFEREGYTSKTPGYLFQTMTPEMQKDMRRLVP